MLVPPCICFLLGYWMLASPSIAGCWFLSLHMDGRPSLHCLTLVLVTVPGCLFLPLLLHASSCNTGMRSSLHCCMLVRSSPAGCLSLLPMLDVCPQCRVLHVGCISIPPLLDAWMLVPPSTAGCLSLPPMLNACPGLHCWMLGVFQCCLLVHCPLLDGCLPFQC
jgi:hypothetical protein